MSKELSLLLNALKQGPVLGRFKMVYRLIHLKVNCSVSIHHFEMPTHLSDERA